MKKLLLIMAAALMMMTQCRKQETMPVTPSAGRPVEMTVTVGPGSKTDIASTGGITWSAGDKLYVGYDGKYVGYLTLASGVGGVTGMFTGSVELTGVAEGSELTFHFYYLGSADHTNLAKNAESVEVDFSSQDITKDGNKLTNASKHHVCYGSANGTVIGGAVTDINVMMVSKVAIAHFNFKKGDADYKGTLKLSGTNICNKMTVNFNSEMFACTGIKGDISLTNTTSSEKYVMLVPTVETTGLQTLTFAGGNVKGETTLENGIKPNKFYGLNGALEVPLKGPFSVSATTGVEFSPGNLYWDGTDRKWKFEANQWEFSVGELNESDGRYNWDANHVSHFFWSATESVAYAAHYSDEFASTSDVFFTNSPSFQVSDEDAGTWRTLSDAEWEYLLNTRTNASSLRAWKELDRGERKGLVILPDGTDASMMEKITSTSHLATYSAVFLPAAGSRESTYVSVDSFGFYWSSTPKTSEETKANGANFEGNKVSMYEGARESGDAVRLVR